MWLYLTYASFPVSLIWSGMFPALFSRPIKDTWLHIAVTAEASDHDV